MGIRRRLDGRIGWKADISYLTLEKRNLPARAFAYDFAAPLL